MEGLNGRTGTGQPQLSGRRNRVEPPKGGPWAGRSGRAGPYEARGEKRASHEAGPKGLGHWDTPSIGRKRPFAAASASRDHVQEPLSLPPYADPARRVCEVACPRRKLLCLQALPQNLASARVGTNALPQASQIISSWVDAATLPGTGVEDNRPKPKPP
jgi:hypothetical protein